MAKTRKPGRADAKAEGAEGGGKEGGRVQRAQVVIDHDRPGDVVTGVRETDGACWIDMGPDATMHATGFRAAWVVSGDEDALAELEKGWRK